MWILIKIVVVFVVLVGCHRSAELKIELSSDGL